MKYVEISQAEADYLSESLKVYYELYQPPAVVLAVWSLGGLIIQSDPGHLLMLLPAAIVGLTSKRGPVSGYAILVRHQKYFPYVYRGIYLFLVFASIASEADRKWSGILVVGFVFWLVMNTYFIHGIYKIEQSTKGVHNN